MLLLLLGVEGVMKAMVGLVRVATIAIRENLMVMFERKYRRVGAK